MSAYSRVIDRCTKVRFYQVYFLHTIITMSSITVLFHLRHPPEHLQISTIPFLFPELHKMQKKKALLCRSIKIFGVLGVQTKSMKLH